MLIDPVIRNPSVTLKHILRVLSGNLSPKDNFASGPLGYVITGMGPGVPPEWQVSGGGVIVSGDVAHGGTGLTVYSVGDLLYAVQPDTLARLVIGSANMVLTSTGGAPAWAFIANANVKAGAAIAWSKISKVGAALSDFPGAIAYAQLPSGGGVWVNAGALSITGGITTVAGLTSSQDIVIANNKRIRSIGGGSLQGTLLYVDAALNIYFGDVDGIYGGLIIRAGGSNKAQFGLTSFAPLSVGLYDLGELTLPWKNVYANAVVSPTIDALDARLDVLEAAVYDPETTDSYPAELGYAGY